MFRKVNYFCLSYPAGKCQSLDLNPSLPDFEAHILYVTLH